MDEKVIYWKFVKFMNYANKEVFNIDRSNLVINYLLKNAKYRNKSHIIEEAIKLLKEAENDNKK